MEQTVSTVLVEVFPANSSYDGNINAFFRKMSYCFPHDSFNPVSVNSPFNTSVCAKKITVVVATVITID